MHSIGPPDASTLRLFSIRTPQDAAASGQNCKAASEYVSRQVCCSRHPSALQVDCEFTIRVVHAAAAELDLARLAGTDRKRTAAQRCALCGADGGAAAWTLPSLEQQSELLSEMPGITLCSKFLSKMRSCPPKATMAHLRAFCMCLTDSCTLQKVHSSALTSPAAAQLGCLWQSDQCTALHAEARRVRKTSKMVRRSPSASRTLLEWTSSGYG